LKAQYVLAVMDTGINKIIIDKFNKNYLRKGEYIL